MLIVYFRIPHPHHDPSNERFQPNGKRYDRGTGTELLGRAVRRVEAMIDR